MDFRAILLYVEKAFKIFDRVYFYLRRGVFMVADYPRHGMMSAACSSVSPEVLLSGVAAALGDAGVDHVVMTEGVTKLLEYLVDKGALPDTFEFRRNVTESDTGDPEGE